MIIRCERCSTLYELDETLLAPEGSEVQCTRCQYVFIARPSRASGQTLQGVPTPQAERAPAEPPAAERHVPSPAPPVSPEPHAPPASASHQAPRFTPGPSPAVYRPPISQPSVSRPPLIRRDTVGTFESRLRWSHRWKWLAPTLFFAVAALGVVAFLARDSIVDPRAREAHRAALELAYRDDLSSLQQARARLDDAIRTTPRLYAAQADRALVDLLLAGALSERAPDRTMGFTPREASALLAEATTALEHLEGANLADGEVARARAVAAALGTDRAKVRRLATAARAHLAADPLVEAAEQAADVNSGDKVARERAVGALALLVSRRPDVIRARYVLARGLALSGRRSEALATLDGLLAANPRHESAIALKETLVRAGPPVPAPVAASPAAAPQPEVRAEKPPTPPRKPDSTSGEASGVAAPDAAAGAGSPPPPPRAGSRPTEASPATAGTSDGPAPGVDRATGEPESPPPAPRLRPAAVPEPEPVQGGG